MTLTELLEDKREEILQIAAQHGATNVRAARRGSDVDILITLEPERSLLDLVALKQDLEDLLDCKVDVVTEASVSPYIRLQVLQDAVAL